MDLDRLESVREAARSWLGETAATASLDPARRPHLDIPPAMPVRSIQAAVSPDCSYRLACAVLQAARHEICLYIYNISAEHMLDLLRSAQQRGVRIRLMYDALDTRGGERQKIAALGVEWRLAPSTGERRIFTVCHQKFAVIDEDILLLGSANWAGTSIPPLTQPGAYRKANREWLVRIDHAPLARWFKGLFEADWAAPAVTGREVEPALAPRPEPLLVPAERAVQPARIFDIWRPRLTQPAQITPLISPENYFAVVKALILAAQTSIDIEQQYILASGPLTEGLLAALAARRSEVSLRIIVSPAFRKAGLTDNWELSAASLKQFGLDDRLRAMNLGAFTHLHNKGLIVDRRLAVVSSTNWSENSIGQAREAGVLIESAAIAGYFSEVFEVDWTLAQPAAEVRGLPDVAVAGQTLAVHPADLA